MTWKVFFFRFFNTLQEARGPFFMGEAPLMAFRVSASYWYSYLCRGLYLVATEEDEKNFILRKKISTEKHLENVPVLH